MRGPFRRLTGMICALCLLAGLAGFAGALHPALDSLAVVRLPLFCLAELAGLALSGRLRAGVAVLSVLGAGSVLLPHMWPGATGAGAALTLYQKNLLFTLRDPAPVLADIRASGAQVVTLQEVDRDARTQVMDALAGRYPHRHWCAFAYVGGTAVLSALPVVAGSPGCAPGLARFQVQTARGPVWIVSVHMRWPWPYRQPEHSAALARHVAALEGPVVIGGDFNAVPAMAAPRRIARAARARPARPAQVTFYLRGAPLGIDHVMGPLGGTLERRPTLGSDHFGLLARVPLP